MIESRYLEMFYAEAFENHEELDRLFTVLEKNKKDPEVLESIFRIMHTLKGNAMGLGLTGIAELGHVMEDVFGYVKENSITISKPFFDTLYRANDKLSELIEAIKTNEEVSYMGIAAKIKIELDKLRKEQDQSSAEEKETEEPVKSSSKSAKTTTKKKTGTKAKSKSTTPQETKQNQTTKEDKKIKEPELVPVAAKEEIEEVQNVDKIQQEIQEIKKQDQENTKINFSDQIQIPVKKLDTIMNLMGELIIEKDTIITQAGGQNSRKSSNLYSRLHRITSDMQYAVMDIRMIQVGVLFNKFHRIVRDTCEIEGKEVDLKLEGTEIEIDRNILKSISDSLVHLVRNAIGHGIESAEDRQKAGKKANGSLTLRARNEKDSIIIEVSEDGKGIDPQAIKRKAIEKRLISKEYAETLSDQDLIYLIFEPGFSNAEKVTEISGRGVGMDVVKRSTEAIGGKVRIETEPGKGSTFILSLPSSMAVKGALLFAQDKQEFAVPLSFTEAVISLESDKIHKAKKGLMADYQGHTMMLLFLKDIFKLNDLSELQSSKELTRSFEEISQVKKLNVIVIQYNEKYVGLVVDKLMQQKEIVEKTLSKPLDDIEIFSGATLLGNGNVCLVLNIAAVMERLFRENLGYRRVAAKLEEEFEPNLN